ncbi:MULTISPECIES: IS1634 family transposase [unclassified Rhodococcus (in: high G+C Gram-positive bacteria)]|uniref:IS1634 family transposase n=1 Tax=unclassified Rhodococcus (in: high G+C Gram-positive bacteria) TaxID=192944 RepID=UPI00163AD365|nr:MULTISPECIES: IS1634 family transposase [unclassified Rhodococcus (in: high G+C Gram-positive bacteria)]MBC2637593.1 IS1634 family transposase [Rhodococcus sp. 3A]MBC2644270.1 IS1634 family transposase [Rhodococcus sp. 3A]MBC2890992.1 IS1634 family transposase [Rhodococcus sp. 4CII]MBC2897663.1 IS1634 family transposase [Rhodococcus sp. 4CII]
MSSIVGKRQGGKTYYYLVESARVDGKPRIVSQQYLGSADEVTAKLAGAESGQPVRSAHKSFGDVAAVWSILERLGVAEVIDAVVPRRSDAAVSVGTYMTLATVNRVVAPRSKAAFAQWWAGTAGSRWVKAPAAALDHRRFWKAMDRLGEDELRRVETELGRRMVTEFGLDLSGLALDMTNFATFIDSANEAAPIAQRGKAKQKRVDLRLVGLALVITRDGGIPIVAHPYPGDRPDVTQFPDVLDALVARYRDLTSSIESLTVVYDAGQNSAANHAHVEESGIGFVGSLPPSDHPTLLAIGRSRYTSVDEDRYPGLRCVDTEVSALGVTRRAVLTHSPNLHAKQSRGFDQTLAKTRRQLAELQATLAGGRTRRDKAAVQAEIDRICRPRWVREVLTTTLTGETPAMLRLSWRTDTKARKRLEQRIFGKRILFTNRDHWSTAEVVAAYRSQSEVESGFRQLKDTHVVSFSPMHHWTDSKIRVHVFYCVLALAVAHLMRRQAAHAGLHLSVRALLAELADIEETVLLYHHGGKGRPRARRMLTDMTDTQHRLYDLFTLDRYAPTR